MTDARLGYGALFQTQLASGAWETTAEVRKIKPPDTERDAIELTHEAAPDEWVESMPGIRRGSDMTLELNFIPGGPDWSTLNAEFDDGELRARRIVFPNGEMMAFSAYLKKLSSEVPIDDAMSAKAEFVVSGRAGTIT